MKTLQELLDDFEQFHTQKSTQLIHYIAVPAMFFGLLMLLNWISLDFATLWKISFAWILVIGLAVYYYFIDLKLAVVSTVVLIIFKSLSGLLATPTPTTFSTLLFLILVIGAFVLHYIGHKAEPKKPELQDASSLLLAAPLVVIVKGLEAAGFKKYFVKEKTSAGKKKDQ